jgi:hypothetical protein
MPTYAQDDKWRFDVEWKQMKARMDKLEKEVYWLEDYKKKQEEKEIQNLHKKRNI